MAILGATEEHELFNLKTVSEAATKLVSGTTERATTDELVKSNFQHNLYHKCLIGPII